MATSSVHSNAFNFLSFVEAGVDSRTGQYTCSISLPELKCNALCGPALPLRLSFNPLATQLASKDRNSGFGCGWSLALSQYNPTTQMLSLSTGESFKVTGSGVQPAIREQKIESFHFYEEQGSTGPLYWVVHKSGLVEHLSPGGPDGIALPSAIYSAQGHKIELFYEVFKGVRTLSEIQDSSGTVLRIVRTDAAITLHLHPDVPELDARYVMALADSDERVSDLVLPTDEKARWHFEYGYFNDFLCVTQVLTPLGGTETIDHAVPGHEFPGNARRALPRVREHINNPGSGQPPITTRYEYSDTNFLGFGAQGLIWSDDGQDNLYKLNTPYQYTTTEILYDNAQKRDVRRIHRVFNRFHLLVSEETTQNDNVLLLENSYYADQNPNLSFDQQPAQCQLATEVRKTWYLRSSSANKRVESTLTEFDAYGNLLVQTLPTGIREVSSYYPKEGADGCPPDPDDFVRTLKEKRVEPAQSRHDLSVSGARRRCAVKALKNDFAAFVQSPRKLGEAAPTLRSVYRYSVKPTLGSTLSEWLALDSETLLQVDSNGDIELQRTETQYIDDVNEPFLFGRKRVENVTLNGFTQTSTFEYSKPLNDTKTKRFEGEYVQRIVETRSTNLDAAKKEITSEYSLLNGEPLLTRDDNDVAIRYRYDVLGRVVEEKVAPDTAYEARRLYSYVLSGAPGNQVMQESINVKDVKTRTWLDGLHRTVREERQDVDAVEPGSEPAWRLTYSAEHDLLGNLAAETEYDWINGDTPYVSTFDYDDWGEQRCVTGPDGIQQHQVNDPIALTRTEWRESAQKVKSDTTQTTQNLFEKPLRVLRTDEAGHAYLHEYFYDGLGRSVEEYDALDRRTLYSYDAFDRMVETELADGAWVKRDYALHSREDLPVLISVNDIVLGEQAFDGLGRRVMARTGGREQTFSYLPGQNQPESVQRPSGKVIKYQYTPQLGDEPNQRVMAASTADYTYDVQNARLLECIEQPSPGRQGQQAVKMERKYFSTGKLKSERRIQGSDDSEARYDYSLRGRLLRFTDIFQQAQTCEYDAAGRLINTRLAEVDTTFTYDDLGRAASVQTLNTAQGKQVFVSLTYDGFGREAVRTFDFGDERQQLTQRYNEVDALVQRTLERVYTDGTPAQILRDEQYEYDLRARLRHYRCTGTECPLDPYGKTLKEQVFDFDALNNLTTVTTTFVDGSAQGQNTATYVYSGADPTQLREVRNVSADPAYPALITLDYDLDGNLTVDEQGRQLEYDDIGRLVSVSALPGESANTYHYDALDTLSGRSDGSTSEARFYLDAQLVSQKESNGNQLSFMRGGDHLLAERSKSGEDSPGKNLLLVSDSRDTVLGEIDQQRLHAHAYTAYGHRDIAPQTASHLGFNGERCEDAGGYLLGAGYRAYNPVLMRFHSPDSLSPFDAGGWNSYAYCVGDPVNFVDPTGHLPSWAMMAIGVVGGIALGVVSGGVGTLVAGTMAASTAAAAANASMVLGVGLEIASVGTGIAGTAMGGEEGNLLGKISMGLGLAAGVVGGFGMGMKLKVRTTNKMEAAQYGKKGHAEDYGRVTRSYANRPDPEFDAQLKISNDNPSPDAVGSRLDAQHAAEGNRARFRDGNDQWGRRYATSRIGDWKTAVEPYTGPVEVQRHIRSRPRNPINPRILSLD
ncbi:RHS repeat-associated core domain-containing protein [Pseudomonas abietaniphila]|uniref:RHS repeat domain-containing protein n=1 Tax=Pseudomonas abietaniphila TaxID=89065 RepID=UPI0032162026